MIAAETIPMVRERTAYYRLAPWGSAIEDSKNGWLCRLLAWGATSDSKQEAGERLRLGACTTSVQLKMSNPQHSSLSPQETPTSNFISGGLRQPPNLQKGG